MPVQELGDSGARYLSIISGKLSQKVNADTQWAVKREYEVDGKKWEKWELHYKNLSGYITNMEFRQTDFWEIFALTIEQDWEVDILSINTDSRYFNDFGRKLKNIKLDQIITINPYDFEKSWKQYRWLDIKQNWEKITDAYYDWENKKSLNWLPDVSDAEKKKYDKDDWRIFFVKIKKFLKEEIQKVELPSWINTDTRKGDELSVEDLPF